MNHKDDWLTTILGRRGGLSRPSLCFLAHVEMASSLLTFRRLGSPLQHVDSLIIRVYASLSGVGGNGARSVQAQPEFAGVDHHFHCFDACLFLYPTGHFGRT